jgi:hypothetical protein
MRRLNADSLQFDDVRAVGTKDLDLGAFEAVDRYVFRKAALSRHPLTAQSLQPDVSREVHVHH